VAQCGGKGARSPPSRKLHQAGQQQAGVVGLLGFVQRPARHRPQQVGADDGVGGCAQHELKAPHDFGARHVGQGGEQRVAVALEHVGVFLGEQRTNEVGRVRHGAFEQRQESAAGLAGVGRQAQQRAEEGVDDLRRLERLAVGLGLEFIEQAQPFAVQDFQAPLEHGLHQGFLGAEVVIHGRQVDARRAGDLAHGRAVVALLREQGFGGVQDGFAGRGGSEFLHRVEFKRSFERSMRVPVQGCDPGNPE